jgi:hypothetical protein
MENVPKMYCLTAYLPLKTVGGVVEMENVPKMYCLTGSAKNVGLVVLTTTDGQQSGKIML